MNIAITPKVFVQAKRSINRPTSRAHHNVSLRQVGVLLIRIGQCYNDHAGDNGWGQKQVVAGVAQIRSTTEGLE
jgi:hypothetical protein